MESKTISLNYDDFKKYFVWEWGDNYVEQVFNQFIQDNNIQIEYQIREPVSDLDNVNIIWRVGNMTDEQKNDKIYKPRRLQFSPYGNVKEWWDSLNH